jgi:carbon-monoxide dehydrogenase large subunit
MADVPGPEAATVALEADGSARCLVSFPSQGQGHATTIAQIVADRLGVGLERVSLAPVDTRDGPAGSGTFGSRGAVAIAGAVGAAVDAIRARLLAAAARRLEAAVEDIVLGGDRAHVRGFADRSVAVAELARAAGTSELTRTAGFDPPGPTFSGAVHVASVEVDAETGRVTVRRYIVVEDCGPVVNPTIVEGQVHGAVAQGIGEALLERAAYDTIGQPLGGTLMDYALPRAADVPAFEVGHEETPAPAMPGGVKGMGEGGTIGAPAAIANAVADAVGEAALTSLPIARETLARAARGGLP